MSSKIAVIFPAELVVLEQLAGMQLSALSLEPLRSSFPSSGVISGVAIVASQLHSRIRHSCGPFKVICNRPRTAGRSVSIPWKQEVGVFLYKKGVAFAWGVVS